jgi:uncharacterized LabA/DUF88 family protein
MSTLHPSSAGAAAPPLRRTRSANAAVAPARPIVLPSIPERPQQSRAHEAALYWDYENVPLGKQFAESALKTLLARARTFGNLQEIRLYADSCKATLNPKHRAALENAGITLIDCPTSNKKEAVDKKIILDALFFALPRAARQHPCSIILISSDGDFAHMLSRLESVGVRTVAIGKSPALRAVCRQALSLAEACGTSSGDGSGDGSGNGSGDGGDSSGGGGGSGSGSGGGSISGTSGKGGRGRAARAPAPPRKAPTVSAGGPAKSDQGKKRLREEMPAAATPSAAAKAKRGKAAGGTPAKKGKGAKAAGAARAGGASSGMKSIKKRSARTFARGHTSTPGGGGGKGKSPAKRRRAAAKSGLGPL